MTMKTTIIQKAAEIIESYVSDWDPKVLRDAAKHAVNGGSPWEFEGRPEDESEMKSFCAAFGEIEATLPVVKTLSTNATIYNADETIHVTGATVQLIEEEKYSALDSRYIINGTSHAAQDIINEGGELRSMAAGWTVKL